MNWETRDKLRQEETNKNQTNNKEHKAIAQSVKEFIAGEIQSRGDDIEHENSELSRELKQQGLIAEAEVEIPGLE